MKRIRDIGIQLIIPIIIVIAWHIATTYTDTPSSILPSISKVRKAFGTMVQTGQLQEDLGVSFLRVTKGYACSILLGGVLGILMGMFPFVKKLFGLITTVIRQIPMIAWIPLIILWCGIGEKSKVVIIVIAAFFPIMVNTLNGVESTPVGYIEVAKLYKLSKIKTFVKVYLPHALPQILVGLKLSLGVSWMAVVASELIAATSGIGYRMSDARSLMRSDIVIVCMLVIGLVGIIMDKGLTVLFRALTPWERGNGGKANG
ncbi:ABC transporter permease [Anaerosporobacter sp.]|uniref:ABC transporter permease n=1 Tax=Anaerosporobacter sp. TaxID=1872529 RepID=UPI00286F8909|nr:ABC transporter permease [Anaerosporobacter sp.]